MKKTTKDNISTESRELTDTDWNDIVEEFVTNIQPNQKGRQFMLDFCWSLRIDFTTFRYKLFEYMRKKREEMPKEESEIPEGMEYIGTHVPSNTDIFKTTEVTQIDKECYPQLQDDERFTDDVFIKYLELSSKNKK